MQEESRLSGAAYPYLSREGGDFLGRLPHSGAQNLKENKKERLLKVTEKEKEGYEERKREKDRECVCVCMMMQCIGKEEK